jgi:D-alanine-D-alanine ligase
LPYPYAPNGAFGPEELEAIDHVKEAFAELPQFRATYFDDHAVLIDALREARPDVVLNLCDTGYRNRWEQELNLPALLELLDIPYTGAGPAGIVLSNDKTLVAAAARERGIPVPDQITVDLDAEPLRLPDRYPVMIKPNVSCGSFGITENSVVNGPDEAERYMRWVAPQLEVREVLIQELLVGAEYTVGVIGNPDHELEILPPLEVNFSELDPELPKILTHGSKAEPDSPYWSKVTFERAQLDDATHAQLADSCRKLVARIGLRDYARIDFRCDADGVPHLLDANVNPTWFKNGKMAVMAGWAGHSYPDMLRMIVQAALRRAGVEA